MCVACCYAATANDSLENAQRLIRTPAASGSKQATFADGWNGRRQRRWPGHLAYVLFH